MHNSKNSWRIKKLKGDELMKLPLRCIVPKNQIYIFQERNFMLNRKQILSMASLVIGATMLQTAAWAGPTRPSTGAPGDRAKKPTVVKLCYYDNLAYSDGSVIKGNDGVQIQCVGDKWEIKN
jgi:hypothetical protein